ncbi:alpha/beta hydrolase [Cohnella rhizosphaerae]|uniref:Alpha/beta hydrolase n=1 Tax=Cohnella rhizosphaerae TaxID=1457232 RepID=A0A9X4KU41_9BACL|nr:alpha/beta hydrolase [Cohnella rhizosphaerae]MDG0808839.1 alpha/beta hydrolase [Cohnella rhizosphaerae]
MDFMSRVHPELREGLGMLPALKLPDDLDKVRNFPPLAFPHSPEAKFSTITIAGAGGQPMLVNVYEPASRDGRVLPALLWLHGGGYVLGHPDYETPACEELAVLADCVVYAPDYRLAPEHPYPAGLEDAYAALAWLAGDAEAQRIDASRIAIGGGSAGGGLCAALALLARDRGGPSLCYQMPLYPMIDDRHEAPSSYEITEPAVWNRANNIAAWQMYLGGGDGPYAAPARAERLEGLPPAYICIGQLDLFRDETISYAARLAQAGVEVELHLYPGCYHAFENFVRDASVSKRARESYIGALARAFAGE